MTCKRLEGQILMQSTVCMQGLSINRLWECLMLQEWYLYTHTHTRCSEMWTPIHTDFADTVSVQPTGLAGTLSRFQHGKKINVLKMFSYRPRTILPCVPAAVVRAVPVWHVVGRFVLQHEPGWEFGSHRYHTTGSVLQLEDHHLYLWCNLHGLRSHLPAAGEE